MGVGKNLMTPRVCPSEHLEQLERHRKQTLQGEQFVSHAQFQKTQIAKLRTSDATEAGGSAVGDGC